MFALVGGLCMSGGSMEVLKDLLFWWTYPDLQRRHAHFTRRQWLSVILVDSRFQAGRACELFKKAVARQSAVFGGSAKES